uniref:Uncharacterized protein n=1 Tax=Arundo donax TaxID=35708 RepID=A0A0A9BKV7_ARUDO
MEFKESTRKAVSSCLSKGHKSFFSRINSYIVFLN